MAGLIASKYGDALFELAVEKNKVLDIEKEVKAVKDIFDQNEDIIIFLDHPKVTIENKIKFMESIFKSKISEELMGLLVLVVNKKRYMYFYDIFDIYLSKVNDYKNIAIVNVTTSVELTKEHKQKLINKLSKLLNKEINLNTRVDKSIIGGMIIRIGDRVIDSSIKSKLDQLSKQLTNIQL